MATAAPPASRKPKRDIADFFKFYHRPSPESTIPRKRPSPSAGKCDDNACCAADTGRPTNSTPTRSAPSKNATPTLQTSLNCNTSDSPTKSASQLPIRSPRSLQRDRKIEDSDQAQRTLFRRHLPPKPVSVEANIRRNSTTVEDPVSISHQNPSFTFSQTSDQDRSAFHDGTIVAVQDSDEDELNELESLQDIFANNKHGTSKTHGSGTAPSKSSYNTRRHIAMDEGDADVDRLSILRKFTHGSSKAPLIGKDKLRQIYARERGLKFDLGQILNDELDDQEMKRRMERMKQEMYEEETEHDASLYASAGDDKISARLLTDVILGREDTEADSEDVARVMSALERTEALDGDMTYSFFDWKKMADAETKRVGRRKGRIPQSHLADSFWDRSDATSCDRAFLSGIVIEKAAEGELSDEILRWIFDEIVDEEQDDLRRAYLQTLEAGSQAWTRLNVTVLDVQTIFQKLGARREALQDKTPIQPQYHQSVRIQSTDLRATTTALELFRVIASDLDMVSLSVFCSILLRLSLDSVIMSNGHVAEAVETLFDQLLDLPNSDSSALVHDHVFSDASRNLKDPVLQAKLLSHISASSQKACELRRALALFFLLGDSSLDLISNCASSVMTINQLTKCISTSPSFQLSEVGSNATANDYAALAALVSILDVAIGSGGPDSSFESPVSSSLCVSSGNDVDSGRVKNIPSMAYETQNSSSVDTKIFNAAVDDLANTLKSLLVSIKDSGASHMRRTEAKDILQALHYRLLYHVRIGVRRKQHVFECADTPRVNGLHDLQTNYTKASRTRGIDGETYRSERKGRALMSKFLNNAKQRNTPIPSEDTSTPPIPS